MSANVSREALAGVFADLDWANIDDLYEMALKSGVFGPGFYSKVFQTAAKDAIRRALKHGKLKDVDGTIIKVASIVMRDKLTGKSSRVYKREDLFTVEDAWQVYSYWDRYERRGRKMKRYYATLGKKLHGVNFTRLFPCFKEESLA